MLGEWPALGERTDALFTSDIADNIYSILKDFPGQYSPVWEVNNLYYQILTPIIRSINPTALAETSKVLLHICFRVWCLKSLPINPTSFLISEPCSHRSSNLSSYSIPLSPTSTEDYITSSLSILTSPITNFASFLQNVNCKAVGPTRSLSLPLYSNT
ncbi:uncharacterized protein Bfra_000109 [Botrytis fragariae]|uniref:Uncharacterized protein n=1 Tax=Botrytis fragariae TaxID=1964551 RepID=A0A8H6B217_9HELO|nr:uncharacterized protein Bfra_000109 [Botrytis fragariae]KAF5877944.1 hypothetical protein Bfra_000109 [Botrytis fragariae]